MERMKPETGKHSELPIRSPRARVAAEPPRSGEAKSLHSGEAARRAAGFRLERRLMFGIIVGLAVSVAA